MTATPHEIVTFWREAGPQAWFKKSDAFDEQIRARFGDEVIAAREGHLDAWIDDAQSCLALLLLRDQFPRNIFRDTPDMFASDSKALEVARIAVDKGYDAQVEPDMTAFVYMPFMHSEALADQERCVALFTALNRGDNLRHANEHADIIRQFGRFPHRNAVLGRESTPEEEQFLADGGFAG